MPQTFCGRGWVSKTSANKGLAQRSKNYTELLELL